MKGATIHVPKKWRERYQLNSNVFNAEIDNYFNAEIVEADLFGIKTLVLSPDQYRILADTQAICVDTVTRKQILLTWTRSGRLVNGAYDVPIIRASVQLLKLNP